MAEMWKTALCALVLALALMAAWVQEAHWMERPDAGGRMAAPQVTEILWQGLSNRGAAE